MNRRQFLFSIDACLVFRTIFIRVDSKYHGRNVEISKDRIDDTSVQRLKAQKLDKNFNLPQDMEDMAGYVRGIRVVAIKNDCLKDGIIFVRQ